MIYTIENSSIFRVAIVYKKYEKIFHKKEKKVLTLQISFDILSKRLWVRYAHGVLR